MPNGSAIAAETIKRFSTLYDIEREIRGKMCGPPCAGSSADGQLSPLVQQTLAGLPRKSDTAAAIRYALSRWPALTRCLDDGSISMDNSPAERAPRTVALANHHDGFDTWNSKHHAWNSSAYGPHRDVLGTWAAAVRRQGLRFGVTVHQARNWWWFQPAHGADQSGSLAGIPYDGHLTETEGSEQWWQGLDPQQLYGVKHPFDALPDVSYVKNFYDRTRDLIDQHNPDLLYFDNSLLPLGWAGMNIGAYFYNNNLKTHGGNMEAILNIKEVPDNLAKAVVADYERGLTSGIAKYPWQSETCIGDWHYNRAIYDKPGEYGGYLPPSDVVHWMIDTVSRMELSFSTFPESPTGPSTAKKSRCLMASPRGCKSMEKLFMRPGLGRFLEQDPM